MGPGHSQGIILSNINELPQPAYSATLFDGGTCLQRHRAETVFDEGLVGMDECDQSWTALDPHLSNDAATGKNIALRKYRWLLKYSFFFIRFMWTLAQYRLCF
jgi:hypothetical protein